MRRREFLWWTQAAFSACVLPYPASAQQHMARLAFVHSGIPADKLTEQAGPFWVRQVFRDLRELGHAEGKNLVIERYSAEGHSERFASLAAEVLARAPDVIVVNLPDLVKKFTALTNTVAIVAITADPIAAGLVTNLAHPGANLTGVSINAGVEIYGKRLQIVKEAVPGARKVAALVSGVLIGGMSEYQDAARRLGVELIAKEMPEINEDALRRAFDDIANEGFHAIIVDEGGSFLAQRSVITALATEHRIPVCYPYRDYIEENGLLAYAPDLGELAQRIANDVHQILNGAKPGDIPFYQPNTFRLMINLRSARSIGLDLPPDLLAQADEIVD